MNKSIVILFFLVWAHSSYGQKSIAITGKGIYYLQILSHKLGDIAHFDSYKELDDKMKSKFGIPLSIDVPKDSLNATYNYPSFSILYSSEMFGNPTLWSMEVINNSRGKPVLNLGDIAIMIGVDPSETIDKVNQSNLDIRVKPYNDDKYKSGYFSPMFDEDSNYYLELVTIKNKIDTIILYYFQD